MNLTISYILIINQVIKATLNHSQTILAQETLKTRGVFQQMLTPSNILQYIHTASSNMTNLYPPNHLNPSSSEGFLSAGTGHKMREVYISPFKQVKQDHRSQGLYGSSSSKFIKVDPTPHELLPPKAAPFRRSRNLSKDRSDQMRERSGELKSFRNLNESLEKKEKSGRIASLEKKLHQERSEGEKWRNLCGSQQQKMKVLGEELSKSREQRQALHGQLLNLRGQLEQNQRTAAKYAQQIETLSRSLKQSKINQKSLANLKQLQNQLDLLQQKNTTLSKDNEQLLKSNKKMKIELGKRKEFGSQSQFDTRDQKMRSLQMQVKRLKEELSRDRSQRELLLQNNLHNLERKLYEKQNEIKRISIQMSCLDRRKYISIDEVKAKKDQEIKELRLRFNKINKDLKETKNKIEQNELRRAPKSPFVRKIKSSQLLGAASESEDVTFEFSSEA